MTILVVGASGATGRLLVGELLRRNHQVKAIVRNPSALKATYNKEKNLNLIQATLLDLSDADLIEYTTDCDAIASCLGHNLTLKGVYGKPRKLVTDATRRLCEAVLRHRSDRPVKFVLMNTTGNRNKDLKEQVSTRNKIVVGLLRALLPPHPDNEQAAEYLRSTIGQNNKTISWAAVRPDGLVDEEDVSEYTIHPSPTRDPIFNAGKTSRINVANFMAELITDDITWQRWKGQMPVIYNKEN